LFLGAALDGYEALELMDRARHISATLADYLPEDRERAIDILVDSLDVDLDDTGLAGMASFLYMPHVCFVGEYGLDCFATSMKAQYELTKRFTAEFSIRAYLEHREAETLDKLREWATDPNHHVRRLVSEGTRPRLPWAPRLRRFQADPTPVLALLELLKDDPEEYVRRSVANNLNDIAKDHPERVVKLAQRWSDGASPNRRRLIRHALRTLVKQGNPGALEVLGYRADSPATVRSMTCTPDRVEIGDKIRLEVEIENPSAEEVGALVDLRVHFVKANGSRTPKVFKGAELALGPRGKATVRKTISLKQHTTRKHYPGKHLVEVMINGRLEPGGAFELR